MPEEQEKKILIVDDNPDDITVFVRYLQQAGFAVIAASSVAGGMDIVLKEKIDCALVDYKMPSADGIEMVRKLKADSQLRFIPVIILTGLEAEKYILEGLEAGAEDYVGKSSSSQIIIARINAVLRTKKLQGEIRLMNERLQEINSELRGANEAKTAALNQLNKAIISLREISIRDSLTGLYNHGYFRETLDAEVKRAVRYNQNICCLMLDLDYFKKINDNYGHLFGDKVLIEVTGCMKNCLREIDFLARYGGEEFAILLFNIDYKDAFVVAERLRKYIESYNFKIEDVVLKLTTSIGIASLLEDGVLDKERFLGFSDAALYGAKTRGRNNVVMYKEIAESEYAGSLRLQEIENKLYGITEGSKQAYLESVKTLIFTLEERDPYTREHTINVLRYSLMTAREMGLAENEVELIGNAALLHDLGKIGISDKILLKKEKLTDEEVTVIKRHPAIAVTILQKSSCVRRELQLILHHHERWDGKGYPVGLRGENIPLGARVIAVADSYDAMRSARPYREALPIDYVISELVNNAGTQFDPQVVSAFISGLGRNQLIPPEISIEENLKKVELKINSQKYNPPG